ncbi:MAG TPA: CDP-glycerol glycerophosphotransferase family protein [Microlunatus sp.]|nr:CDP-glycerol glycerophosphotransferase family protein [Microlunatus sp.]
MTATPDADASSGARSPRPARPPSPTTVRLIGLGLDLAVVVVVAAGVGGFGLGSPAAGLFLVMGAILCGLQLIRSRVAARTDWAPLGNTATGPRAAVLAGLAAAYAMAIDDLAADPSAAAVDRAGQASATALAAFMGLGALVVEPLVARATRYTVPVAAHLPGVAEPTGEPDLGPVAVIAGLTASGVGAVLLSLGVSAWWWLVVVVAAVLPLGALVALTARRILAGRRRRSAVPRALARYAPDFLLYTGRPDDASYQISMWLDYFRRTGLRFAVVTRYHQPARALAGQLTEPVVEARSAADLAAVVPPSARAVFYVNASARNGELVADRRLRHVYIGHGDSDKPPSFNPTHALYDEIFTAGPAAARRYPAHGVAIAEDKFRVVGRPQVEHVSPTRGPIAERRPPVVLYAPTWRGHVQESALSSLPVGELIVGALLERGATVIFRPHPFSRAHPDDMAKVERIGSVLADDAARTGRPHLWGPAAETELSILDCLNVSDAMVTDVSSVVSDYLFSGKPFAMVAVPSGPAEFAAEYPVSRAAYVLRGDLSDLDPQLDAMLGADPMRDVRAAVRVDYLGDLPADSYSETFVAAVREVVSTGRPSAGESSRGGAVAAGQGAPGSRSGDSGSRTGPTGSGRTPTLLGGGAGPARGMVGPPLLELAGALMALAALVLAVLDAPGWLVAATVVLSAAELLLASGAPLRSPERWPRLLGYAETPRVALAVSAPLAVALSDEGSIGWLLAPMLTVAALVAEDRIRAGWEGGLVVRRLPGVVDRVAPLIPRGVVPMLGLLLIGVAAVMAAVRVSAWLAVAGWLASAGAVVLAVAAAVALERALRRADDIDHAGETLRSAVRGLHPEFVVYTAGSGGAERTVGPWLPVLDRIGRPWLVVTRSPAVLDEVDRACRSAGVDVPLVLRGAQRGVEDVVVPGLTTALYVDDAPRNTHLIERRDLTHVRLNLGVADCHPVHAVYDVVYVPRGLTRERYAAAGVAIPEGKLRPVADPIAAGATDGTIAAFLADLDTLLTPR